MHIELTTMEPNIALVAGLIGDQARARMLTALMGGQALTATELALEADITAQTASSHLSKLVSGELLVVRKQGRHRYFQIKDAQVAELLEQLLTVTAAIPRLRGTTEPRLRRSRVCYDHLAGELGVHLFDALIANGWLTEDRNHTHLTDEGRRQFVRLGAEVDTLTSARRPLCKACLDWSERRSHLAGSLGQWILDDLLTREWAIRDLDSRAIAFTPTGFSAFSRAYQLDATAKKSG